MHVNKEIRVMSDQQLIAGIKKHFGKTKVVVVEGEEINLAEVIVMLEERVASAGPVADAKATWLTLAKNERKLVEATQPVIDALRKYLAVVNGENATTAREFGFTPRKRRGGRKPTTTTTVTPPPATTATPTPTQK